MDIVRIGLFYFILFFAVMAIAAVPFIFFNWLAAKADDPLEGMNEYKDQ